MLTGQDRHIQGYKVTSLGLGHSFKKKYLFIKIPDTATSLPEILGELLLPIWEFTKAAERGMLNLAIKCVQQEEEKAGAQLTPDQLTLTLSANSNS